jgi:alcohol dehydrogenase class IV
MSIREFTFDCHTQVIFTHHIVESLKQAKESLGVKRAFVITDPSLAKLNHFAEFREAMDKADFPYDIYADAQLNPDDQSMDAAFRVFSNTDCDSFIGFGGGSVLDTAKTCALLATNGGKARDYFGVNTVPKKHLPCIAIPTTAGSGADVTYFIAIVDNEKRTKAQILDVKCAPDISILYPENLLGMPQPLIPAVGFDSLTHSVEGYINAKANAVTECLSIKAFELMSQNLVKFYQDNSDLEAAGSLLLATTLGCLACTTIGTGDAHCIARSVGGRFHNIHHGTALAVSLPHVLNFNLEGSQKKLAELARAMNLNVNGKSDLDAAKMLVLAIQQIRDDLHLPGSYKELGMTLDCLEELAYASKDKSEHGSSAGAPPRKASIEEYKKLITDAYNGVRIRY